MRKMRIMAAIALTVAMVMGTTAYASSGTGIFLTLTAGAGDESSAASVYDTDEFVKARVKTAMSRITSVTHAEVTKDAMQVVQMEPSSDASISVGEAAASEAAPTESPIVSGESDAPDSEEAIKLTPVSTPPVTEEKDEYADLCITTVDNSMNVRAEASEEADVVGYLYSDCIGEMLEHKDGWTLVKSGDLKGWAKDEYLHYGSSARDEISNACMMVAVINTETLRVRSEASEDASVNALLALGDEVDVVDRDEEGWTEITYEDGTEGTGSGYVSDKYITVKKAYKEGETVEEVEEREEKAKAQKKAAEEKAAAEEKTAKEKSEKSKSEKASNEKAAEAATQESATTTTNNGAVAASVDEETLLAALIQCECNGPYEGQLAVGAVVMNRVKTGYGSIQKAIYAPGQFGPASSGKLAATLATGAISGTARQAAHDAIGGLSNVGGARYFRNVRSGHAGIVVGNHVFW